MPPCDLDAEAAVLSAIVLDPGRIDAVQAWLPQPVMFFSWANQRVYEALIEMDRLKQKVDIMTLAA
ncbi:MAG: replicative DNA helicase, partial [Betaproteobacteria bacterium]|nr:replicative DNA helicase [Betaproteobacteria bacterium]